MSARGVEVATERMLEAEAAGDFVAAVWWANGRDRIIASNEKRKAARQHRGSGEDNQRGTNQS